MPSMTIDLQAGWNLIALPGQPANPTLNAVINAKDPVSALVAFDNAAKAWRTSRRSHQTGLLEGDVAALTAHTPYFIYAENPLSWIVET